MKMQLLDLYNHENKSLRRLALYGHTKYVQS